MSGIDRPPALEPTGIFEGLRPAAILLGVACDNLATLLLSPLLVALFSGGAEGAREITPEALEALYGSTNFLLSSLVVGLSCTAAGAFIGARRAGCHFARHGAWIGVCAALVGLACYPDPGHAHSLPPLWFDLLGFALLLPAGALGGMLAGAVAPRRAG